MSYLFKFAEFSDISTIMKGAIDIMEIEDGTRSFSSPEMEKLEIDAIRDAINSKSSLQSVSSICMEDFWRLMKSFQRVHLCG